MKKTALLFILILSGCSFTISPPIQHDYIPLYPDTAGITFGKINFYLWPLDARGIKPYYDTTLLFIDSHGNAFNVGYYHPLTPNTHFKVGISPFYTLGVIRAGVYDTVAPVFNYTVYTGIGIRILPHFTYKHFIFGAHLTPIAIGFWLPVANNDNDDNDISGISALPEMFDYAGVYAYYTTSFSKNMQFYAGPTVHIYPFVLSGGINSGLCFYKKEKENLRVGLSIAYYRYPVYDNYNLFPFAFMFSVWKMF